jgi:4-amino-4-deoxy-L-arabinose transferase-like glycosyltransferase
MQKERRLPAEDHKKRLAAVLAITLGLKLFLAWLIPVTGDEAYFFLWGQNPALGFYDHPPMVGWFLTPLMALGDALWWLRLPTILITTGIGWGIYRLLRGVDQERALLAATLYLLAPATVIGVPITTDTPLILWSFLSALCFYRAQEKDHWGWYLAAGVFLGLAFLSKFFAGILGLAFVAYLALFVRRGWRPWVGIVLVVLGTVPFIALNLAWNYDHCWDNYLFNLFNRTRGDHASITGPLLYVLMWFYLATPPVFVYLVRGRSRVREMMRAERLGLFAALILVAASLFALLSIRQAVGLHWVLSFYPFLFIATGVVLSLRQLKISTWFMGLFTAIHVLVVIGLVVLPTSVFKPWKSPHQYIVLGVHTDEVLRALRPLGDGYLYATTNYSLSATLAYRGRRRVIVFGPGSEHGRQDDILTDFRTLEGKNILILQIHKPKRAYYASLFKSVAYHTITVEEAQYYVVLGRGFRYPAYRDGVLAKVRQRFYRIPKFLPCGACYMNDRYFQTDRSTEEAH